jgi:DNA-binding XRE family transcriptional regulator
MYRFLVYCLNMDLITCNTVKARRDGLTLSQQALAGLAGVSISTIAKLEAGKFPPRLETARAISKALGASIDELWPEAGE